MVQQNKVVHNDTNNLVWGYHIFLYNNNNIFNELSLIFQSGVIDHYLSVLTLCVSTHKSINYNISEQKKRSENST